MLKYTLPINNKFLQFRSTIFPPSPHRSFRLTSTLSDGMCTTLGLRMLGLKLNLLLWLSIVSVGAMILVLVSAA